MSVETRNVDLRGSRTTGIVLTLLAAMSFALAGFIAKGLIGDGVPGVIVAFYEAAFGLVLVGLVSARGLRRGGAMAAKALPWILIAGVSFSIAIGSFYTSLSRIDFSTGAPIVGAVPLASFLFVLLLLRGQERITRRAMAGAVLVVVGVGIVGVSA